MRPVTKCDCGWFDRVPAGDLVVGQQLFLEAEAIERPPRGTNQRLHDEFLASSDESKRFVRRGLLDACFETERLGQRQATETHVGHIRDVVERDPQEHVSSGVTAPSGML